MKNLAYFIPKWVLTPEIKTAIILSKWLFFQRLSLIKIFNCAWVYTIVNQQKRIDYIPSVVHYYILFGK